MTLRYMIWARMCQVAFDDVILADTSRDIVLCDLGKNMSSVISLCDFGQEHVM